jgi:cytoplasmic tRNA 2-thiolation protein 2
MADQETARFMNGSDPVCKRCNARLATQRIRSEQVCQCVIQNYFSELGLTNSRTCFSQYVATKAVKRMETYRVRGSTKDPKKLLFPLSFGSSSASLLHILDQHLQGQYDRMNRAAYELYVIHVDLHVDLSDRMASATLLEKYKSRYPRHIYTSVGLEEALLLEDIEWQALGMSRRPIIDAQKVGTRKLQELIATMPSTTSRTDIISTLLTRLLVDVAKKNGCDSILFADSTTRLAEKTLTMTAKGRGFSVPWQVSDGASPYGVGFNYPLRDVLKKEVVLFSSLTTPPLIDLITLQESSSYVSASSKSTTIDDLMAQYFESVEENYPSIVANVVRTSSKLKPLIENNTQACGLCGFAVAEGTDGIYGWGGDQNSNPRTPTDEGGGILCYGCSRSING